MFEILPQIFDPVIKAELLDGDNAIFGLKMKEKINEMQNEVLAEILVLEYILNSQGELLNQK